VFKPDNLVIHGAKVMLSGFLKKRKNQQGLWKKVKKSNPKIALKRGG
jgi:hypothetical protein